MGSAISIGTTGLTASSKQMDVIGNNLANSNTLGFKAGNTYFTSMLNQSLAGSGAMSVGQGVGVAAISTQFTQGSFENTGNATDMAIDGNGFFMVKDLEGAMYYTRAGAFHINKEGYLVDNTDYRVQGYNLFTATESIGTDSNNVQLADDISLANVQSAASASTNISIGANLDESETYGEKFNVTQTVFDSKGASHNLSITFQKTEESGMWGFDARLDSSASQVTEQSACGITFDSDGAILNLYKGDIPAASIVGASLGGGAIVGTTISRPGQLYKDTTVATGPVTLTKAAASGVWNVTTDGGYTNALAWQEASEGVEYMKVDLDGKGGSDIVFNLGATAGNLWAATDTVSFDVGKTDVASQDLVLTFGDLGNGATIGVSEGSGASIKNKITWDLIGDTAKEITGYASTSVVKSLNGDGYSSGVLKSLSVGSDGIINGFFTNGQTSNLAQIVLADFSNTSGLKKVGNYFGVTNDSGEAITNAPGSRGLGEILSNSLEISNTDVAKEFVNMITAQRAYQASARVITTADQMLSELMNIKR
ncbi:MAG: flagellar hook protein FlgE [Deltaproteobacteria bacterium]|nr:flagellar hook protein FlgE [Deltaproteobacteria bacterium]